MARVLVIQHVAAEPLGVLDPMLRRRGHRIRYVNFARQPEALPKLERYQGLVILGGPMQVTQTERHPHLLTECCLIERALQREIPVLGICLGAQLITHVLGGRVGPCSRPEIGWYPIHPTAETPLDPLLAPIVGPQPVFQWHHWGFDCPGTAVPIADSPNNSCQAFRYNTHAWGLQFHLELDQRLIQRWLKLPAYREELIQSGLGITPEQIETQTRALLPATLKLAEQVFGAWLDRLDPPAQRLVLASR